MLSIRDISYLTVDTVEKIIHDPETTLQAYLLPQFIYTQIYTKF